MGNINVQRKSGEIEALFDEVVKLLEKLCGLYDNGLTYSAVLIGALLRTLLKDTKNSNSLLQQLGMKNSIQFMDSSIKDKKSFSFWTLGDNVSNINLINNSDFYGGLLAKKISKSNFENLTLDFEPLLNKNADIAWFNFDDWYETQIFESPSSAKMTRKDIIETVTDKDGGAHVDAKIPDYYAEFREPTSLHFKLNGEGAVFNQNPVYVSIRQIAYELLESFKNAKLTTQ